MSWRKHFSPVSVNNSPGSLSPIGSTMSSKPGPARANYSSYLPEVYTGAPNRIERYLQYSTMDMDSEVNAALDILAEFCTETNNTNQTPFNIVFKNKATNSEVSILREYLQQWCKLQKFETRMFRIVRNTFKNGDSFFIRDPETFKWHHIDPSKLVKIIVNESEGKVPEQYVIKDLSPNFVHLVTTAINANTTITNNRGTSYVAGGAAARGMVGAYPANPASTGSRFNMGQDEVSIDANHVVHISLSEGLDNQYPFGNSLLETIFKVYKQKELLEDAILIYRIQRAPERRIFYIDVGNMPSHLAMTFVERVKNEIQQRRIPSPTGMGGNSIDSAFSPLSQLEDFYLPVSADSRGSKVDVLPGGCFSMDTKVSLLDGRELSIREIEQEMKEGKELWTYSCEPKTGKIVPGLISWAGVTQKSAQVMKLTLDNGEHIICTPDHKFPQYGEDFKRAMEFKVGDSLIPLYRRKEKISKISSEYEQFFDNSDKKWKFTHRIVAKELKDILVNDYVYDQLYENEKKLTIHHKSFNRFDNSPENLCFMNNKDHFKLHSDDSKLRYKILKEQHPELLEQWQHNIKLGLLRSWDNLSEEERLLKKEQAQLRWNALSEEEKLSQLEKRHTGLQKYFENISEEDLKARQELARKHFKKANEVLNEMMKNDPEYRQSIIDKKQLYWTDENRQKRSNEIGVHSRKRWSDQGEKYREIHKSYQVPVYSHNMLKFVIDLIADKTSHEFTMYDVVDELNNNEILRKELYELNKDKSVPNWNPKDGFTRSGLRQLAKQFGYDSWIDLRKKKSIHNHRIVAIEYLPDYIEVGTLTIDGNETYHNYHTFALTCGVMVFNSNVGEITDLTYFTNKLFRALRIPSSYLPTGADDSQQQYTDGRVGTAYIQELRFNKYCIRLQSYMQTVFDQEFKYYLFSKGVNIDSSIFDLKFNPPQNFASYRQSELDDKRTTHFGAIIAHPIISKRFAMKRYLGWSEEEIAENERMWAEENGESSTITTDSSSELRNVGISQSGIQSDMAGLGDMSLPGMAPEGAGTPQEAGATPTQGVEQEAAPQG